MDDTSSDKRRKLMSTFRQSSIDETRFTPVEKFCRKESESTKFDDVEEDESLTSFSTSINDATPMSTNEHHVSTVFHPSRPNIPDDTIELIPRTNRSNFCLDKNFAQVT